MSSIEVSLMASNHKSDSNVERTVPKPQRPPPPPPSHSAQLQTSNEQMIKCPELETHTPSVEPSLLSEFRRLFDPFDYESVREAILSRQMTRCHFTTVLWRVFLHCLPRDSTQWNDMLETSRRDYEKLVDKYKIDPYKMSDENCGTKTINHPLSRDENSLWAQYFADEELKATITIDVRRTWPDIAFFRDPRMIDLQLRILFIHSRHHHKIMPYRQGMHEILGIIVYVIHSEILKINQCPETNELMKKLYDSQYLEHDAHAIFEKIMDHLRQFYALTKNNSVIHKSASVNNTKQIPFQRLNDLQVSTNDTVARINSIFERLRQCDRAVHSKLTELNIEPTFYGIRWLRVLFGREIPFESIPNLWTVIFCFDEHFGFVDHFFLALLMEVVHIIEKQGDVCHSSYLQSFMKQNVINNDELVIRKALNLTGRQLHIPAEESITSPMKNTDGTQIHSTEKNDRDSAPRTSELQRVFIAPAPNPRLTRPHITDVRKSMSPPETNHLMNTIKRSTSSNNTYPISPQPEVSKSTDSNAITDLEPDLWAGKTIRQKYEDNSRIQKSCAQYMNKFIERLQDQVCELKLPNEDELLIQISGLKQIANILDGKLTFDGDSLQTLLNYKSKESPIEANDNNSSELS
ncbi:unnamed protein product [Adineta ricciae]|uniref:Rab-GAP TBC domain-containing protein n=1 Tax=Adineta ricciae TaxID=249248 RepID=A0A814VEY6_ADIRI|nr:unnamed protein product [Adineta ricciae]CAF1188113.1 unnamed protein product [Adineta ricciae]